MSKAMQLVGIILLGIFTLVIINLMNDVRSTNELDYYLLQETVEASMYDAVDYSYYRDTSILKVDRDMFLESFNRRFAESVDSSNFREYKIKIIDFNEAPPKASVEVTTVTAASVKGEGVSVVNRVDGIIETIYDDYVYSRGYYQLLVNPPKREVKEIVPSIEPEPEPTPTEEPIPVEKPSIVVYTGGTANEYISFSGGSFRDGTGKFGAWVWYDTKSASSTGTININYAGYKYADLYFEIDNNNADQWWECDRQAKASLPGFSYDTCRMDGVDSGKKTYTLSNYTDKTVSLSAYVNNKDSNQTWIESFITLTKVVLHD